MPERAAVERGLAYPEGRRAADGAGWSPLGFWTVGQTIDYLRARPVATDSTTSSSTALRPVGSIPLGKIVRGRRGVLTGSSSKSCI
jgi:hypothetical protein